MGHSAVYQRLIRYLENKLHSLEESSAIRTGSVYTNPDNSGNSTEIRTVEVGNNAVASQRRQRNGITIGVINSYFFPSGCVDADKTSLRDAFLGAG